MFQPHDEGIRLFSSPWNTTSFVLKIRVKYGESLQKEREIKFFPSCKLVASCKYFSRETNLQLYVELAALTNKTILWALSLTDYRSLNNNWSSFSLWLVRQYVHELDKGWPIFASSIFGWVFQCGPMGCALPFPLRTHIQHRSSRRLTIIKFLRLVSCRPEAWTWKASGEYLCTKSKFLGLAPY